MEEKQSAKIGLRRRKSKTKYIAHQSAIYQFIDKNFTASWLRFPNGLFLCGKSPNNFPRSTLNKNTRIISKYCCHIHQYTISNRKLQIILQNHLKLIHELVSNPITKINIGIQIQVIIKYITPNSSQISRVA